MSAHHSTENPRPSQDGVLHDYVQDIAKKNDLSLDFAAAVIRPNYPLPHTGEHPQEGDPSPEVIEEKVVEKPAMVTESVLVRYDYPVWNSPSSLSINVQKITSILLEKYGTSPISTPIILFGRNRSSAAIISAILFHIELLKATNPQYNNLSIEAAIGSSAKGTYPGIPSDRIGVFIDEVIDSGRTVEDTAKHLTKTQLEQVEMVCACWANHDIGLLTSLFPNLKYIYY